MDIAKKIFVFLILALLSVLPANADNDQKTLDFLKKLNGYYCCLSQGGLNNYSCVASVSLTPRFKKQLRASRKNRSDVLTFIKEADKLTYTVTGTPDGESTVDHIYIINTDDLTILLSLAEFLGTIDGAVKAWSRTTVCPLHLQHDDGDEWKVQNDSDGFTVTRTGKNHTVVEKYDRQAKMLSRIISIQFDLGSNGSKPTPSVETFYNIQWTKTENYSKTLKGYLIKSLESSIGLKKTSVQYEYEEINGYLMPSKMRITTSGSSYKGGIPKEFPDASFVLTFSNYKFGL